MDKDCSPPGQTYDANVKIHGWTNDQDPESCKRRSNIICEIIENQDVTQLNTLVGSEWDVDEVLYGAGMPMLYKAVAEGWTEGVKMLLDAGAKTTIIVDLLLMALQCDDDCPTDMIKVLLEHGIDPNDCSYLNDDDYEGDSDDIPLIYAVGHFKDCESGADKLQLLLRHGADPNTTYPLNIGGCGPPITLQNTALHDAALQGWTEGVKMLIDAGADKCMINGLRSPLAQAVKSDDCSPELIRLLLYHGADPNDHDWQLGNIPLLSAIDSFSHYDVRDTAVIKLLLEYGANPNVTSRVCKQGFGGKYNRREMTALEMAGKVGWTEVVKMFLDADYVTLNILENTLALALGDEDCPPDLVELLVKQGADLNHAILDGYPLIHRLCRVNYVFYQKPFDLFFFHGGDIEMEDSDHRTALESTVRDARGRHINSVRWLIRHGADTSSITLSWMKPYFMIDYGYSPLLNIPLILQLFGIRALQRAQQQLSNIESAIYTCLQQKRWGDMRAYVHIWDQLKEEGHPSNHKKFTFPEYLTQQNADLQEFSDDSLLMYPEDSYINDKEKYQNILCEIQGLLELLSQPLSLYEHCRFCVRANLVSLQPSVVKALPIPAKLKRYIMCHEI